MTDEERGLLKVVLNRPYVSFGRGNIPLILTFPPGTPVDAKFIVALPNPRVVVVFPERLEIYPAGYRPEHIPWRLVRQIGNATTVWSMWESVTTPPR